MADAFVSRFIADSLPIFRDRVQILGADEVPDADGLVCVRTNDVEALRGLVSDLKNFGYDVKVYKYSPVSGPNIAQYIFGIDAQKKPISLTVTHSGNDALRFLLSKMVPDDFRDGAKHRFASLREVHNFASSFAIPSEWAAAMNHVIITPAYAIDPEEENAIIFDIAVEEMWKE